MANWQSRIVGYGEEDPEQLCAHPHNWRAHTAAQRRALETLLDAVGWVQAVIVNRRTGYLIDGHLRVLEAIQKRQPSIPVVYVDLDETEERLVLASLDPIGALAQQNDAQLSELLDIVSAENDSVVDFLQMLHGEDCLLSQGDIPVEPVTLADDKGEGQLVHCPKCGFEWRQP